MIALIGAMKIETDRIRQKMCVTETQHAGSIEITLGTLSDVEIALLQCGVGKVAAATATAIAIERFAPALVINVGVAGGLSDLKVFDVVLPEYAVEHDMDTSALGDPKGYLSDLRLVRLALDRDAIARVRAYEGVRFVGGVLASGDVFVEDAALKARLQEQFEATCCDMEGAACAHTCAVLGTPCIVMRTISDSGDGMDFLQFADRAAEQCATLLQAVLPNLVS